MASVEPLQSIAASQNVVMQVKGDVTPLNPLIEGTWAPNSSKDSLARQIK